MFFVHLILTIVTGGLWLPVWIICYTIQTAGRSDDGDSTSGVLGCLFLIVIAVVASKMGCL